MRKKNIGTVLVVAGAVLYMIFLHRGTEVLQSGGIPGEDLIARGLLWIAALWVVGGLSIFIFRKEYR